MDPETLFSLAGFVALPGWALRLFLPFWRWSTGLIPGVVLPAVLGLFYAALIVTNIFGGAERVARSLERGGVGTRAEAVVEALERDALPPEQPGQSRKANTKRPFPAATATN